MRTTAIPPEGPSAVPPHHRIPWWAVAGVYAFFLLAHNTISDSFHAVRRAVTDEVYARYLNGAGAILLLLFLAALARILHCHPSRARHGTAWLLFGGLIAFNYQSLIVYPAEYIHFPQYVLFTLMVYNASGHRWLQTLVLCIIAGTLDEAWQTRSSATINPRDVLLNVIGIVWAVLIVWTWQSSKDAVIDAECASECITGSAEQADCPAVGAARD